MKVIVARNASRLEQVWSVSATNCFIKLFFWPGDAIPCILRLSIEMERGIGRWQKYGPQAAQLELSEVLTAPKSVPAGEEVTPHAQQHQQVTLFVQSELIELADLRLASAFLVTFQTVHPLISANPPGPVRKCSAFCVVFRSSIEVGF